MNMLTLLAAVFWNAHSPWFQFAPALDFSEVKGAAMYRYTVLDDLHHSYEFLAADSKASLAPVWDKIPTGGFAVVCEGLDAASNSVGLAVHATKGRIPRYWKTAQFKEGSYPPAKRSYGEAAKMIYDYIFEFDSSQVILKTGKPDRSYFLNSYPCKMYADIIRSMITYAKMRPERAADAMRLADNAAEYLLSVSEPAGAPLEYFPPTYEPDTNQTYTLAAKKYRGQTMISYPAHAGDAFLKLGQASGKRKYIDAAVRIAETFLKLQLPDDSWYLKLWIKDGSAVNPNKVHPTESATFLEAVYAETKDVRFRESADRAMRAIDRGAMQDMNWEGQFEDVEPTDKYVNLAMHPPCDAILYFLNRYPGDKKRIAEAEAIMKLVEDQFVLWEKPVRADGATGVKTVPGLDHRSWTKYYKDWYVFPSVTEQYHWNVPIDASMAKVIRAFLILYRETGDRIYLAKAKAMGDALTNAQLDSGRIPTQLVIDNLKDPTQDWLNCMLWSAGALEELSSTGTPVPTHTDAQKAFLAKTTDARRAALLDRRYREKLAKGGCAPKPVTLEWSGDGPSSVTIKRAKDGKVVYRAVCSGGRAEVDNLEIGTAYEWSVTNSNGTAGGVFLTEAEPPRLLRDPGKNGVVNIRDLGGYIGMNGRRVRQGMIFRSARLAIDDDNRAFWRDFLGIKTEIDLRNEEDRGWYTSSPIGKDVTWVNAAIGSYNGLFTTGADFCKAFDVFLDPSNYPVDFHCSAGRDRTGVTAYILNAVLGVAKADLDKDWEANIFQDPTPEFNHTNTLDKFTANLAKFDGVTVNEQAYSFLRSLGYTESQISTFREIMLEPATNQYR